jgi:hypothetical protein
MRATSRRSTPPDRPVASAGFASWRHLGGEQLVRPLKETPAAPFRRGAIGSPTALSTAGGTPLDRAAVDGPAPLLSFHRSHGDTVNLFLRAEIHSRDRRTSGSLKPMYLK